ncbi:MAG TPA: hypothetical protein IAA64_08500 [Candidatus Ornithocaccomicrobium faecavium]|uniref:ABC-2 family transporter protein n=1 Tax=Candidatus Ornithocaccomicrobium faecavium TaxID=2840890 RepID=A0A9D1P8U2_9FIRM|nr:hypothetical protein [Candidatus Ornithocaccomicrobium faecavium]
MVWWHLKMGLRRKEFWLGFVLFLAIATASFLSQCYDVGFFGRHERLEMFSASTVFVLHASHHAHAILYVAIVPLVASVSISDVHYLEEKNKTESVLYTRVSKRKYLRSQAVACFVAGFLVAFVPLVINQIWACIGFPLDAPRPYTSSASSSISYAIAAQNIILKDFYFVHPYGYNLLFSLWVAYYSAVCALFSYAISFYIKKRLVINAFLFLLLFAVMYLCNTLIPGDQSVLLVDFFIAGNDTAKVNALYILALLCLLHLGAMLLIHYGARKHDTI